MCGILYLYIYIYHIFVVYISDTFFLQGPHELSASRWRWTNHPQQRMQCLWLLSQKKLDWYCAYLCINNTVSGCFIMCSWNCNGRKLAKSLKTPSDSSCLKRSIQRFDDFWSCWTCIVCCKRSMTPTDTLSIYFQPHCKLATFIRPLWSFKEFVAFKSV